LEVYSALNAVNYSLFNPILLSGDLGREFKKDFFTLLFESYSFSYLTIRFDLAIGEVKFIYSCLTSDS
jgi:hypothetical protein